MFGNISPFFTIWGPATATQGGILTASAQSWLGDKTNLGNFTVGSTGIAATRMVRVATDGAANHSPMFSLFRSGVAEWVIGMDTSGGFVFSQNPVGYTDAALATAAKLKILGTGLFDSTGAIRVTGSTFPASGTGTEIDFGRIANTGSIFAFDRTASGYKPFQVQGSTVALAPSGTTELMAAVGNVSIPNGLTLGASGTKLTQVTVYAPALVPASVAANTTAEQTFTVTGLATTDAVFVNVQSAETAGLGILESRVSAANTIAIRWVNATAGALTPVNAFYRIVAIRS